MVSSQGPLYDVWITSQAENSVQLTKSCNECRRRKKKCPQGHPCLNCARQIQPIKCEYRKRTPTRKKLPQSAGASSNQSLPVQPSGSDEVRQAQPSNSSQPHTSPTDVPNASPGMAVVYANAGVGSNLWSDPAPPEWVHVKESMCDAPGIHSANRSQLEESILRDDWAPAIKTSYSRAPPIRTFGAIDHAISCLPMTWTQLNRNLLQAHIGILSRFKTSIDGRIDGRNRFMENWAPFCLQEPLLLQIALFTAACFFNEIGAMRKEEILVHEKAIYFQMNASIAAPHPPSDALLLAVSQLAVYSWYWGQTQAIHTHRQGVLRILELRGGLQNLGMRGFLSKIILVHDIAMSIAHEDSPEIHGQAGFGFHDASSALLETMYNSPLLLEMPASSDSPPPFSTGTCSALIKYETAWILNEMRQLILNVTCLDDTERPDPGTPQVKAHARLLHERLSQASHDIPLHSTSNSSTVHPPAGHSHSGTVHDPMYRCVRLVAMLCCRAIEAQQPTSQICSPAEFRDIWNEMWKISRTSWNDTIGVLFWIFVIIVPSCHGLPATRMARTLFVVTLMSIGVNNWQVAVKMSDVSLKLQDWLQNRRWSTGKHLPTNDISGGEAGVDKFGFVFTEWFAVDSSEEEEVAV